MAEDMRFELTEACTSPPFQDGALNRSANPPGAYLLYIMGYDLSLIFYIFKQDCLMFETKIKFKDIDAKCSNLVDFCLCIRYYIKAMPWW